MFVLLCEYMVSLIKGLSELNVKAWCVELYNWNIYLVLILEFYVVWL